MEREKEKLPIKREIKLQELNDEQLDQVVGGGWGKCCKYEYHKDYCHEYKCYPKHEDHYCKYW
jgi:bacteriocin-like protein